ncbi:unnamed protein product [Prunus armeniaca]
MLLLLFTSLVFTPELEGQSSSLPWKPLTGQQIEGSDPGWTGYVWAGLSCQQLQLLSFSSKSISKFNFARALIYFKLCEAFEWAELRLLQSEGAKVALLEDLVN